jgi:hypothetical protein
MNSVVSPHMNWDKLARYSRILYHFSRFIIIDVKLVSSKLQTLLSHLF